MRWFRWPIRIVGVGVLLALATPALAPWLASVLDRGPGPSARISAFPAALTLFDPFVWRCVRNSVAAAGLVAMGSMAIGVGLGMVMAGRSWVRGPMKTLAVGSMAAGPILIGSGLAGLVGGSAGDWLEARSILGMRCDELARWAALTWMGLAIGAPMVALATASALRRVDPAWSEAARAAGASRSRAWRDSTWPTVRPVVARAASAVFALTLVEPAGPMILGLRRTLAVQMIAASRRLDEPTRAATLAAMAILIAVAARSLLLRWGGPAVALGAPSRSRRPAGGWFGLASVFVLAAWSASAIGPAWLAIRADGSGGEGWSAMVRGWWADPERMTWAANSATSAALAVGLDLLALAALAGAGRRIGAMVRASAVIPPLALGVGAMAVPWLVVALADIVGGGAGRPSRLVAEELAPGRSPGWLLAVALAAARLPMLLAAAESARARSRPILRDAALMMGMPARRARRRGDGRWLGLAPVWAVVAAFALASADLGVALLLPPISERRTLAPAALGLVLGAGGEVDARALGPIAAVVAVNLIGLTLAARARD